MLVLTSAPTIEPITLAQAKLHLRVTGTDEDALITTMIGAARRHGEAQTGRSFITQSWRQVLDEFPCCIELERGDVQRIDSVTYRDMTGTVQTVAWAAASAGIQRSSDATMLADLSGSPARLTAAFGHAWPNTLPEIGAVAVNYTAGYGDAAVNVPEGVRQWILLRIGTLYENREEVADGIVSAVPHLDALLDPYRVELA